VAGEARGLYTWSVKVSWLSGDAVRAARRALEAPDCDWDALFSPDFEAPAAPLEIPPDRWPRIAEHVARAERVSALVRERGVGAAAQTYGGSAHAVEVATVAAAAEEDGTLGLDLLELVFACAIDEYVAYGTFLDLLSARSGDDPDRAISIYERFTESVGELRSDVPMWGERANVVRDGLAGLYVRCGRMDSAERVFRERHDEERDTLVVSLSASRAFLAAGAVARAVKWLGLGAARARALGRPEIEARLLKKQGVLRGRMS
jgi:hypothetical protein